MTLLPEGLFLNLLDIDLQQQIAEAKDINFDVNLVLQTLLNKGPNIMRNDLFDWMIEKTDKGNILFYCYDFRIFDSLSLYSCSVLSKRLIFDSQSSSSSSVSELY